MRIIGGSGRGRRILSVPEEMPTRPISARIKQSLFDILRLRIEGARFLDLYAGTGAVGLEALSRGAARVFFVELDRRCLEVIGKNLERAGFSDRGAAHPGSVLEDLSWVGFRAGMSQFDLIFMGPPYKDREKRPLAYTTPTLKRVMEAGLLAPGGIIICQYQVKEPVEIPAGLAVVRREKYGDSFLTFIKASKTA